MIDIVNNTLYSSKIKKDINIVLIADIHFSRYFNINKFNIVKDKIKLLKPDYICISGDIIDLYDILEDKHLLDILTSFLVDLTKISKVFIALGNHDINNNKDLLYFKDLVKIDNLYLLNNSYYIDDYVVINGYNPSYEYYYNKYNREDYSLMYKDLLDNKLYFNDKLYNISLIHSPNCLLDNKIKTYLNNKCNLVLCGHMHNGLVFRFIDKIIKNNYGFISPAKRLFPKLARGYKKIDNIDLIITGGITKLSNSSGHILRIFDRMYPISVNNICIKSIEK